MIGTREVLGGLLIGTWAGMLILWPRPTKAVVRITPSCPPVHEQRACVQPARRMVRDPVEDRRAAAAVAASAAARKRARLARARLARKKKRAATPVTDKRSRLSRAARVFFSLKAHPRFKDSLALKRWKKDFLAQPDLRAINRQYYRDGNAVRFVVKSMRAPGFRRLVGRYMNEPDIQSFAGVMRSSPAVMDASRELSKEPGFADMTKDLLVKQVPVVKRRRTSVRPRRSAHDMGFVGGMPLPVP